MGWDIRSFDVLPSTQDTLKQLLREKPALPLLIRAKQQTAGRGRHGRRWLSDDAALTFSFAVQPKRPLNEWGSLSLLAGCALAQAIDLEGLVLKWPNDILYQGQKCAGILCEIEEDCCLIGVGINLSSAPAVERAGYFNLEAERLMTQFMRAFDALFVMWNDHGFASIRALYLSYALPQGTQMSVKSHSEIIEGCFEGVGDMGELLLREQKGAIRTITSGEMISV